MPVRKKVMLEYYLRMHDRSGDRISVSKYKDQDAFVVCSIRRLRLNEVVGGKLRYEEPPLVAGRWLVRRTRLDRQAVIALYELLGKVLSM